MRTTDTWLFELNRFAYFDTGIRDGPLMNCQKVVARDPRNSKMVTARFCQLDTADSDACQILGTKLGWPPELARNANKDEEDKDKKNANKRKVMNGRHGNNGGGGDGEQDLELHCSICHSDGCNGSENVQQWNTWCNSILPLLIAVISRLRHSAW
ncbi:unnamed protein product [Ceratitis capitata]|nr:unnamed protein product [Ceratitis capitata]